MPSTVERHHLQVLQSSPSMIDLEATSLPPSILDVLSEVYCGRSHRRCMKISYLAILSMVLAVVFWIAYWLSYNRCENVKNPSSNRFLCDLVLVFEGITFGLVGVSPFLIVLTIYSWSVYACYNPFDSIRDSFLGFKIEGEQWRRQLDYYYRKKKTRYLNCLRCKQRRELAERGYGYIILSPHGIVIDELLLFTRRKNFIDSGSLSAPDKLLEIVLKGSCRWPWKTPVEIYLPEEFLTQRNIEELMDFLKVQIDTDKVLPSSV